MSYLPYIIDMERIKQLAEPQGPQVAFMAAPQVVSYRGCNSTAEAQYYWDQYMQPWKQTQPSQPLQSTPRDFKSTIKHNKNKFQVNLDVQHFLPEEISVKICDGFIIIEAQHEEKKDEYGWVSRQFTRRYPVPDGCTVDAVVSRLSSDGVLTVIAPLQRPECANERVIPIIATGPVKTCTGGLLPEYIDGEEPIISPLKIGQ